MLSAEELAACRATHEEIMVDAISIRHPGGTYGAIDPNTGKRPFTPNAAHYTGKASVQALPIQSRRVDGADQQVTTIGTAVKIPVTVTSALPEDIVTVTASQDPAYAGRVLIAKHVEYNTYATARRLVCTDQEESLP